MPVLLNELEVQSRMPRWWLGILGVALCLSVDVSAQSTTPSAGGAFTPGADYNVTGRWDFHTAPTVNGVPVNADGGTDILPTCNGVTDDTAVIQAALTAGGRIRIAKEGTCLTGALTVSHAIILSGLSTATILKYSGSAASYITVSASDVTMRDLAIDPAGATVNGVTHSIGISRLTYDNVTINASATTQYCGSFDSDSYVVVRWSRWLNCTDRQFNYLLSANQTATDVRIAESVFDDRTAPAGAGLGSGAGINCTGSGNSLTGVVISDSSFYFPGRSGANETDGLFLYCATQGAISGITITGNIFAGNTADSGTPSTSSKCLELNGVTDYAVIGNRAMECYQGILIANQSSSTGNGTVSGNTVRTTTSRASSSTGIIMSGGGKCTVTGNHVQGPWKFQISTGNTDCVTSSNEIVIEAGASNPVGILINASNNQIIGNQIVGPATSGGYQGIVLNVSAASAITVAFNYIDTVQFCLQFNQTTASAVVYGGNTCSNVGTKANGNSVMTGLSWLNTTFRVNAQVTAANSGCITAATTCDVTLATLPAQGILRAIYADLTQTFACSATCTTATLSATVGSSAGGNDLLVSFDLDAATAQFGKVDGDLGTGINRANAVQGGKIFSWSSTTTISMRITSGTGNLGTGAATNLSQGSITFYILTEPLVQP